MARDPGTTKGQSYPLLSQVKDPTLQTILRLLMDQINELRQPPGTTDFGGNTLAGVSDPSSPTHAANKAYVDGLTDPTTIRASLGAAGAAPLDLTGLRGQAVQVQKAKLRVNPAGAPLPTSGQPFELLYNVSNARQYYWNADTSTWVIM